MDILGKTSRVYILAEREFPNGNAGGTRVRYLAKALQLAHHEVTVFSLGPNDPKHHSAEKKGFFFEGIRYENQPLRNGLFRFLDRYLLSGFSAVRSLRKFSKETPENATVIVYTSNAIYGLVVLCYVKGRFSVWMDIVEWFQRETFPGGALNIKYWLYRFCFGVLYPSTKQVIAISSTIQSEFQRRGCKTLLIPSLYDAQVGEACTASSSSGAINLIYSGNPDQKEEFPVMLKALLALPADARRRFKFHLTGVSRKTLETSLGVEAVLLNQLGDALVFHPWMPYEDLLRLYSSMHFLYFVRRPTLSNMSNFPTKLPELMSFRVVPLTNQVGDYGKVLVDGTNAILIKKPDVPSCQAALLRVLTLSSDDIVRMRSSARDCMKNHFDYRIYAPLLQMAE